MKFSYDEYRAFFYINRLTHYLERQQKDYFSDFVCWAQRAQLMAESAVLKTNTERSIKRSYRILHKRLEACLAEAESMPLSTVRRNINFGCRLFNLTQAESEILEAALLWRKKNQLRVFARMAFRDDLDNEILAAMAGVSEEEVLSLLSSRGNLLRYGFLETRRFSGEYDVTGPMREFLECKYDSEEAMREALLGRPLQSEWRVRDFDYVAGTDFAVRLMKRVGRKKGINLLLYGEPGTGKTSFAQMLAARAKRNLYPVGENAEDDRARNYRLQQLHQKLDLLEKDPRACLLFDEAEDLFSSQMTRCNKVEINRLLEQNTCPVIWTTNNITQMDPAFIRRFTLALYFERPPVSVRRKIWDKYLKAYHLPHSSRQTMALAKEFSVPPSLIAGAARATGMVKGDLDTVRRHIHMMAQALQGGQKMDIAQIKREPFNPTLIHTDLDLTRLTRQLEGLDRRDFSLCLYGASGTGKSAYARYLADQLEMEVVQQRASDLISPFVGATEQNIARAFAQAKAQQALLLFDEADSFLQDRAQARYSWERTAVNEMLTCMETHPYPFICTTNLMETLDPACLRRFSFKVKYGFLTIPQVQAAFEYFFGLNIPRAQAEGFACVTPGDFAVVKNKAQILGVTKDPAELLRLLDAEQTVKNRLARPQIGFCK